MTEDMPRNSESQMISKTVSWIKNNMQDVKVLFTWANVIKPIWEKERLYFSFKMG